MINQNGCGRAIPPQNAEAFADALIEIADTKGLARQMGDRGRRLAETQFGRDRLSDAFVECLETA